MLSDTKLTRSAKSDPNSSEEQQQKYDNDDDDQHNQTQDNNPNTLLKQSPKITLQNTLDNQLTQAQIDHLKSLIKIIRHGDFKDFIELLESGALKNLLNVFVEGQTALHYSLIYGRSLAWCKELVVNGANPNLTNFAGWHPIHLAAFNGSSETMRYLIDCSMPDW